MCCSSMSEWWYEPSWGVDCRPNLIRLIAKGYAQIVSDVLVDVSVDVSDVSEVPTELPLVSWQTWPDPLQQSWQERGLSSLNFISYLIWELYFMIFFSIFSAKDFTFIYLPNLSDVSRVMICTLPTSILRPVLLPYFSISTRTRTNPIFQINQNLPNPIQNPNSCFF